MRTILLTVLWIAGNLFAFEGVEDSNCVGAECERNIVTSSSSQSSEVEHKKINETKNSSTSNVLQAHRTIVINVVGEGVAPANTISPAQAYALAKRAAIVDAYRLIAEKVRGVEVQGEDDVKNMIVQHSLIRTSTSALIKNARIVETTFRDGLCEVEMEIRLSYDALSH